ncbi:peptidoglycan DD-metalloendopeptidase family protein [Aquisalimonas lutea]|uniref:peptidoglycan DD-metalloendopeptidase family protein n=1 Tax=Aquisalimonas lutea TaxID=1327750 RepID=UPI0025B40B02|nr:peptidoglycan DD-metalloendopeptidase family protein [Aquisalimonas lutea]MDN3518410.1 peptidoglycan DD-metalloendopeptidase family protein [Aquisalimonas lutea]
MDRGNPLTPLVLVAALLTAGCAGDHLAPVSERSRGGAGAGSGYYEVRRGDTLYGIAWDHGLDHRKLARWNDLDSPDRIYAGQRLRLSPPPTTGSSSRQRASSGTSASSGQQRASSRGSGAGTEGAASGPGPDEWRWPTEGEVVKSFSAEADGKQGISIGGEAGQSIRAAADGEVVYSGAGLVGYGNLVILKHSGNFLTAYGYNRRLLVEEGQRVSAGEAIAEMGSAIGEDGTRLHFELRSDGRPVDPLRYLP